MTLQTNEYYTNAVLWAAQNNIVLGYGDDRFGPNDDVTREQLAAILYRYQQFTGIFPPVILPAVEFADGNQIGEFAKEAVTNLTMQGIINGKPGNLFDPQGNATRAECAAMLHRSEKS
ncbi:MAG: S-layer homology domain-containing protein [Peptococcaceae bacterium]|nr:S-layer homology domain-containing protein [Peptococcaceae bacterium]